VNFCFKAGQTLDGIKRTIQKVEEKLGEPVKFIVIDYSELVIGSVSDPTQKSMETIQGLREISNELNKCVLVLLQPNKASSNPTEPLLTYNSAKGSSSIAQAVTTMITAHRPGYGTEETDHYFSINVVKNRMGPLFGLDFHWNGLRGMIRDLDAVEKMNLEQLRATNDLNDEEF
jgi:replicative DNA helicase